MGQFKGDRADDEMPYGNGSIPDFNIEGQGVLSSNKYGASSDFLYLDAIGTYDDIEGLSWDKEGSFRADYLQDKIPVWNESDRSVCFDLLYRLKDEGLFGSKFPHAANQEYLVVINQRSNKSYLVGIWPAEEQETSSVYYPMANKHGGHRQIIQTMIGKYSDFQRSDFQGRWFAGSIRFDENGRITHRSYDSSIHTEHSGPSVLTRSARIMFDKVLDSIFKSI
ncbi:MAG: hypothetical protein AB8G05_25370 [Oligoflexales bacterium]